MSSRLQSVVALLERLSFDPIDSIAHGFVQLGQPVVRMPMRLERQADPAVILGHVDQRGDCREIGLVDVDDDDVLVRAVPR
jgi:hypothetical protein